MEDNQKLDKFPPLSKDFIEDEAIPLIKSALRKGGDLGIAW